MRSNRHNTVGASKYLLAGSVLAASLAMTGHAQAQSQAPAAAASADDGPKLEEIVVTAQKREQNMQDVPIAVTALSQTTLQVNRVVSVEDLSGLAPGVQVRSAAGGTQLASFTIRGAVSYGVVPGSDKEVSIYLDGVYLSSPRGSIFELPDVSQIEVLRGPQGTLFGRNATAGAVSITTRDPTGKFDIRQDTTLGNLNQFRSRTSVDLPQIGPFSAYASFVHDYIRGDIRNANAGVVWNRTAEGLGIQTSPAYLGTKDANTVFAALKFEPSDRFSTVYKFNHGVDHGSPEGSGLIGFNPNVPLGPGLTLGSLLASQSVHVAPDGLRPDVVNNGFATNLDQWNTGHNLTSKFLATDNLSFKNVLAYRESYLFSNSASDGFGGIAYPGLPGTSFVGVGISTQTKSKAWSDELQANYHSRLATITAGLLWFHSTDTQGGPSGALNTVILAAYPGNVIPLGQEGFALNKATSLAAYTQVELHVTSHIDIVGGIRVTKDDKTGTFTYDGVGQMNPSPTTIIETPYKKTKPNYLIGVNYKPNSETLLYGKFSTSFVSGGPGANPILVYAPETASSFEGGVKADLLDHRLRTNLAIYTVSYKNVQAPQGSSTLGSSVGAVGPYLGTFILDQGGIKNSGAELEVTAVPTRSTSIGGSLDYSHTTFNNINPILLAVYGGVFEPTLQAKWSGGVWGQFDSRPVYGNAYVMLRIDANWHDKENADPNPGPANPFNSPAFVGAYRIPATWIVNGRLALRDIDVGRTKAQLGVWAKNITNDRSAQFPELLGFAATAIYQQARTFGVDLNLEFK